jgi:archaellum component FlaC
MFSHLSNLNSLYLSGNTCIDKTFNPVPAKATLENELAVCEVGYLMQIQFRIDAIEKKNDEKFKVLRKLIESNQETFEHQINGTLAGLESLESRINREIETIYGKLAADNDKMEKRLGVYIETNAKEIHEVKKMVEKIKSDIYNMSQA